MHFTRNGLKSLPTQSRENALWNMGLTVCSKHKVRLDKQGFPMIMAGLHYNIYGLRKLHNWRKVYAYAALVYMRKIFINIDRKLY